MRLRLIAYGFLAALVALAIMPAYLWLDPAWRPLAVRFACALIVVVGCRRVLLHVRHAMEGDPSSALDAPAPAHHPPELNERFLRLRDDLVFSHRSRHYFDVFLRPRLRGLGDEDVPPAPEPRVGRRRGPSWPALERMISHVEQRP